jgi:hypothetical protein
VFSGTRYGLLGQLVQRAPVLPEHLRLEVEQKGEQKSRGVHFTLRSEFCKLFGFAAST